MKQMRYYLTACLIAAVIGLALYFAYYYTGFYIPFSAPQEVTTFTRTEGREILLKGDDGAYREFEIRGVDLGAGKPGHYATDYAITKEEYLRWFDMITEMGANTIRVYIINNTDFYEAFYEYNTAREAAGKEPLYMLHGLWLDDYVLFSHRDAYHDDFAGALIRDAKVTVDVIHGQRAVSLGGLFGTGYYTKDVSKWVLGYILGVEWESTTVAYTDNLREDRSSYTGRYMYTTEEATPFEAMLARLGDDIISYETKRYGTQRLVAFANWPTTDPLDYPETLEYIMAIIAHIDVEHIATTDEFISGCFASYHVYPYYPDYLSFMGDGSDFLDKNGEVNTYYWYLKMLADHHTMPVVISEFGVPSSRGKAQNDKYTGRDQGGISETQQADYIVRCYEDIMDAGCAGSIVFSWQDEWFKRTWNSMYAVDLNQTPYWSDYQTNEQSFGLLAFDPGDEECVCYVDGEDTEWQDSVPVYEDDELSLHMKYDERYLYFCLKGSGISLEERIYIPLDITPKTGSTYCADHDIAFGRAADFVMQIHSTGDSRVLVQERYEVLRAMKGIDAYGIDAYADPPEPDTPHFKRIDLLLQTTALPSGIDVREISIAELSRLLQDSQASSYETGRLRYGNANPEAVNYDSLADYCFGEDFVEIKLPWQLLNFSNPSKMRVHDDYYLHYGVEEIEIDEIYVGAAIEPESDEVIEMAPFALEGWGDRVTYHERLKPAYYAMQELWGGGTGQ